MKKRIFAGLVLLGLLICGIYSAYANTETDISIESSLDKRIVTIEGTASAQDGPVLLIIYKPGMGPENIAAGTESGVISKIETIPVNADGSFFLQFLMEDGESGNYSAYFKVGEEIWKQAFQFTSALHLQESLELLNGITAETPIQEIQELYERYCTYLRLPDTWFQLLSSEKQERILQKVFQSDVKYQTGIELQSAFTEEMVPAVINQTDVPAQIQPMLEEYAEILQLETDTVLYTAYVTSVEQRTEILEKVLQKDDYADMDAVREAYTAFSLLQAVNDIRSYSDMHQFLDTYKEDLGNISFAEYNRLTTTQKRSVDTQMTQTEFEELAAVKNTFVQYVSQAANRDSNTGSVGSGGGNRGTSSGGGMQQSVVFDQTDTETQPEEQTPGTEIFSDLDGVEWAKSDIYALYQMGIINGKSKGVFDPNAPVTRSEFIKMLCLTMRLPEADRLTEYSDVQPEDWCWSYIQAASQNGLVQGNPDGTFGKEDPILRQDIAVVLYRALDQAGMQWSTEMPEAFLDMADFDDYAAEGTLRLRQAGIVSGVGDNRFDPQATTSRAEAAKMIYQFYLVLQSL